MIGINDTRISSQSRKPYFGYGFRGMFPSYVSKAPSFVQSGRVFSTDIGGAYLGPCFRRYRLAGSSRAHFGPRCDGRRFFEIRRGTWPRKPAPLALSHGRLGLLGPRLTRMGRGYTRLVNLAVLSSKKSSGGFGTHLGADGACATSSSGVHGCVEADMRDIRRKLIYPMLLTFNKAVPPLVNKFQDVDAECALAIAVPPRLHTLGSMLVDPHVAFVIVPPSADVNGRADINHATWHVCDAVNAWAA
jgi:hypothetical protein